MSKPVMITADSTCDLSAELLKEFNIKTTPLTIQLGDNSYQDGVDFSPAVMYERYRAEGILPTTSAPNIQQFLDFFTPFIEAGYEVVHLDISSDLSSTFANARLAASELEGVYPVDSRMLSSGVALLALEGAKLRDEGLCAADIAAKLEELTGKVDTSFVLDTLEFLHKGGRCSALAAMGANLLNIKPALEMKDGKLGVYKKFRGSTEKVYYAEGEKAVFKAIPKESHYISSIKVNGIARTVNYAKKTLNRFFAPNCGKIQHTTKPSCS